MSIRQKILIYFSILTISLVGIAFVSIYSLFANYRIEEFQQRIKEKTITTVKFLVEIKQIDHDVLKTMDDFTINNLYKEKILIFDENKKIIYTSIDDTKINFSDKVLNDLTSDNPLIEFEEDDYDVVGILFQFNEKKYYGISKAYDQFGLAKLTYLKSVFIIIFLAFSSIILISSYILSKQISQPIILMAGELNKINFDTNDNFLSIPKNKDEINLLANRFNELMIKLKEAFSYQKHAIHHISHELKTPIAILVSNFERMESEKDVDKLQESIRYQKEDTKILGDIINALLEISKVETGNKIEMHPVRIDELIYNTVDEISILNPDFKVEININDTIQSEKNLIILANEKLMRLVIINLLTNCIKYSSNKKAMIDMQIQNSKLILKFINKGQIIPENEKQFLFQHFFRGQNSAQKRGFGLGLVLINKIMTMHDAEIEYKSNSIDENYFILKYHHLS